MVLVASETQKEDIDAALRSLADGITRQRGVRTGLSPWNDAAL